MERIIITKEKAILLEESILDYLYKHNLGIEDIDIIVSKFNLSKIEEYRLRKLIRKSVRKGRVLLLHELARFIRKSRFSTSHNKEIKFDEDSLMLKVN